MFVPPGGIVIFGDRQDAMQDDLIHITRRHLPHWTIEGATYFVTFRTRSGKLSVDEQKITLEQLRQGHGKYYDLIAAVVMPDHVHVLLTPNDGHVLSRIMKGIKGVSARQVNRLRRSAGQVWQHESYDRIVRDERELHEKINYMLNNSVKQGLTDDPWEYHGWYCKTNDL
jgi:REP element-mobilizing transposase RayT